MSRCRHSTAMFALFTLACATGAAAASAADPACEPVLDATSRMAGTPSHQHLTETAAYDAKARQSEIVVTRDSLYMKVDGTWHRNAYDARRQAAALRDAAVTAAMSCRYVRDEAIGGESTALYETTQTQEDGTRVNSSLWISRSRGLPLKQSIDMDVGGKLGKSHQEMTIDYADVQPPE